MIRRFSLLHAFVAVARTGKMKEAADQLSLTPGAVSQRIRQLEELAGQRLFKRTRTGVELTSTGTEMFAALPEPFGAIEAIDRNLGVRPSRRVVVTTMPSFAATWLVPRLRKFSVLNPEIEVVVEASKRPVNLKQEPIDLAIRHGLGNYPGLEATWLIAPELFVVASPELLKQGPPLREPADYLSYPLLHRSDRRDWALWFEAHGIHAPQSKKGPAFSDDHLVVQAAVAGQGLALVRDIYAEDNLHPKKIGQSPFRQLAGAIRILRRGDIASTAEARCSAVSRLDTGGGPARNGSTAESSIAIVRARLARVVRRQAGTSKPLSSEYA